MRRPGGGGLRLAEVGAASTGRDNPCVTRSTTSPTVSSRDESGMPAYLAWRRASARTCHTCQVDRDDSEDVDHTPREFVPTFVPSSLPLAPCAQARPSTVAIMPVTVVGSIGRRPPGRHPPGRATARAAAQAARLVLVGARLEVGLLGQGEGLDPGRRPAVVGLERRGELTLPARDVATTGGPLLEEPCVHALDLADGRRPSGRDVR